MEATKAQVNKFLNKAGKHDTSVQESVAPAVTQETVKPHSHEQVTTAVDKEVHQPHYHTSVQPITDRQVLPEQHHTNVLPVESKQFQHGSGEEVDAKLQAEGARFQDQKVITQPTHSHEGQTVAGGEHVHHHVHEVIQPVVHKETIEPHVNHTVVQRHERHDNAAQFHEATPLPAMTMDEFKAQGGKLSGRETRVDSFNGEPRNIGGLPASNTTTKPVTSGTATSATTTQDATAKPKLTDKLDPRIDADGDGKAGVLS